MKKLLMTIMMALLSSTAFSDEIFREPRAKPGLDKVKFDAFCGNGDKMAQVVDHYKERAMIDFKSQRIINGEVMTFTAVLFANPKDGSWTWIEKITDDSYCIISTGDRMTPHVQK